jgi:hypothetical protein
MATCMDLWTYRDGRDEIRRVNYATNG